MNVAVKTGTCQAHWDDPEHLSLDAEYELQTHARIRNGARPIRLCGRCTAEWRLSDRMYDRLSAIAWVRSL